MKSLIAFTIVLSVVTVLGITGADSQARQPVSTLGPEKVKLKCSKNIGPLQGRATVTLRGQRMTGPSTTDRVFRVTKVSYNIQTKSLGEDWLLGDQGRNKNNIHVGNWPSSRYHASPDNLVSNKGWDSYRTRFVVPRGTPARVKVIFDTSKRPDFPCYTPWFEVK